MYALALWVLLLHPTEREAVSKVGKQDDTIASDSGRSPWLVTVIEAIAARPSGTRAFPWSYLHYLSEFSKASKAIDLSLVPHLARHSGASIDRAQDSRSQAEVAKRGRWQVIKSVRRYKKRGRLNET